MRKIVLFFSLLLCASVASASNPAVEKARALTVMITNVDFGGAGAGTGVLIDSNHVVTCAHMVYSPQDELYVYTYPIGRVIKAHVDAYDKAQDLAILALESPVELPSTPVFASSAEIGDEIYVIGNALGGMKWLVTRGVVSELAHGYIVTDALINPGNSGGPWINAKGEIVALTDWRIGPQDHVPGLAGGIPAQTVARMIFAYRFQQLMRG